MIICDVCNKREAKLYIEQANELGKRKLNLCDECAKENGVFPDSKTLATLFDAFLGRPRKISADDSRLCPVCGTSLTTIKTLRRAGCPECYAIFKDDIARLHKQMGISAPYTGTMPRRLKHFKSVLTDRIVLQAKLEESLKREDYEKAAIYRDYLKALEKSPVAGCDDE